MLNKGLMSLNNELRFLWILWFILKFLEDNLRFIILLKGIVIFYDVCIVDKFLFNWLLLILNIILFDISQLIVAT
jgi:hypothetical protein